MNRDRVWLRASEEWCEGLKLDSGLDGVFFIAVAEGNRSFEFVGVKEGNAWNVHFNEMDYNFDKIGVSLYKEPEDYCGELEMITEEGYLDERNMLIEEAEGTADEVVEMVKAKYEPFIEMRKTLDKDFKENFPKTEI